MRLQTIDRSCVLGPQIQRQTASGKTFVVLRAITTVLATAVLWLGLAVAAAAQQTDWAGGWDTVWRDGGAAIYLEQNDNLVIGTFPSREGVITGEARGRVLIGTWRDAGGQGTFVFALSPDGRSFSGRFGNGEWWNGARMPNLAGINFGADATSPQAALRTILVAGNLARRHRYDDIAGALSVLDFTEVGDVDVGNAIDRFEVAGKLYDVLSGMTFRLWEIPVATDTDELVVVLSQAGTDVTFPLQFRYGVRPNGTAGWFIVVPAVEELDRTLERLEVARAPAVDTQPITALQSARATMRSFVDGYREWKETDDPTLMLSTMNLEALPRTGRAGDGTHHAEYLKGILDRIGFVIFQEISDDPNQVEPYQHFVHPKGTIEIAPVQTEDGTRIWQFSPSTIASLTELFVAMEDMPLVAGLQPQEASLFLQIRQAFREFDRNLLDRYFTVELWKWIALAAILVSSGAVAWVFVTTLRRFFRWRTERLGGRTHVQWELLLSPAALIVVSTAVLALVATIWFPGNVGATLRAIGWLVFVVGAGWFLYRLVALLGELAGDPTSRFKGMDALSRSVVVAILKILVVVGSILMLAEVLGVPWEGVLAGLGIGGIAVALAARSTLENFIGGLTLLADKPVRAGDFCLFGDKVGTIEALGLRSIKIRSLDRTVYTIPNAEFINLHIENFTRRDGVLLRTEIGLRYETSPDQMRWVLTEIRRLLTQHPRVRQEPCRARFVNFADYSLNIEIFCLIDTTDWNDFLAVREDLFLRIADIVDASGSSFAFPSSVNYVARDPGMDEEKTERAERAVEALRGADRLPFPEFSTGERWEMLDTLDYPGPGSPDSRQARERRAAADE